MPSEPTPTVEPWYVQYLKEGLGLRDVTAALVRAAGPEPMEIDYDEGLIAIAISSVPAYIRFWVPELRRLIIAQSSPYALDK